MILMHEQIAEHTTENDMEQFYAMHSSLLIMIKAYEIPAIH